ncbi:MAG TPA: hypothetical protein VLA89_08205 [Gemmatimonadales bacterium]|nr:hypothetical protein [Gemmatimonadales bacterium]
MKPEHIRCVCGTLFGMELPDGTLAIKHRDLYRNIRGGVVEGPCRRCGAIVRWQAKAR